MTDNKVSFEEKSAKRRVEEPAPIGASGGAAHPATSWADQRQLQQHRHPATQELADFFRRREEFMRNKSNS
jgi:hypothetical protein